MNRFSKKMLRLMAEEFFRTQLNEERLSQVIQSLETWLQDLEEVDAEALEDVEPIKVVYLNCDENERERA